MPDRLPVSHLFLYELQGQSLCKNALWILTEIGKAIDIEQSKSIYTRDHGFPPEFIMDVVGYFTKMQEIADEYLDRLLEKYESLDSDNDEEDESVW